MFLISKLDRWHYCYKRLGGLHATHTTNLAETFQTILQGSWDHGLDSLVLRSEVSFGHFTTGAKMSGHFRPT